MGGKRKPKSPNLRLLVRSYLPKAFFYIGSLLLGIGGGEMSTGQDFAPLLISFGTLLLAVYVISLDDTNLYLEPRIENRKARIGIYLSICLMAFLAPLFPLQNYVKEQQANLAKTPIFYGEITPDNKPNPVSSTGLGPGTMTLVLGDNLAVEVALADLHILSRNDTPFLKFGVDSNGNMLLTTDIRSNSNDNIVTVIDNEFQANPNYAFHAVQPNHHSLIVRDFNGHEVLNIYFVNPKTIRVTGTFYIEGYKEPVRILPTGGLLGTTIV